MDKKKVIFDCDPGIDDAFAIAYLFKSNKFDIKMVSSVAGNVELEHTTRNLRGLVKALNSDVEVCEGAEFPIMGRQILASEVHGNNGLAGYEFEDDSLSKLSERKAYEAMVDILENSEEKITIIAVGPLTNISQLILGHPELIEKIEKLILMGGGLRSGNTTPAAEFNILADPEAAHIVFNSDLNIAMIGLDATEKGIFNGNDILELLNKKDPINKILLEVIKKSNSSIFEEENKEKRLRLHDLITVLYATNPEIFTGEKLKVNVEVGGLYSRGMTIADRRNYNKIQGNTFVALDYDLKKAKEIIKEAF